MSTTPAVSTTSLNLTTPTTINATSAITASDHGNVNLTIATPAPTLDAITTMTTAVPTRTLTGAESADAKTSVYTILFTTTFVSMDPSSHLHTLTAVVAQIESDVFDPGASTSRGSASMVRNIVCGTVSGIFAMALILLALRRFCFKLTRRQQPVRQLNRLCLRRKAHDSTITPFEPQDPAPGVRRSIIETVTATVLNTLTIDGVDRLGGKMQSDIPAADPRNCTVRLDADSFSNVADVGSPTARTISNQQLGTQRRTRQDVTVIPDRQVSSGSIDSETPPSYSTAPSAAEQ